VIFTQVIRERTVRKKGREQWKYEGNINEVRKGRENGEKEVSVPKVKYKQRKG
jgi:hypothetical protein